MPPWPLVVLCVVCVAAGFTLGATWAGLGWGRRERELREAHRQELERELAAIEMARRRCDG